MTILLKFGLILMVFLAASGDKGERLFRAIRYPPMEGLMPPLSPSRALTSTECAMMCSSDETCTSFSHSAVTKMCMLSPEVIRQQDIDISVPIGHFYHFNVHEVLNKSVVHLPQGYRWFEDLRMSFRFHYYWPLNYTQSADKCQQEGGDIAVVNSTETITTISEVLQSNSKLNTHSKFYVFSNTSLLLSTCTTLTSNGVNYTVSEESTCTTKLPYICQLSL